MLKDWMVYSFIAFVLWGVYAFFPKLAVQHLHPTSVLFYQMLGGAVVGIVTLAAMGFKLEWHPQGVTFAFLTGVFGLAGVLFYIMAMRSGSASTVAVLTAMYPLITVLLNVMILHESFTVKQGVGVAFALAAMVLLSIK